MKYPINSDEICLYDMVKCNGFVGKVVAIIDDGVYSIEYCSHEWSYLKSGILIYSDEVGLIHYIDLPKNLSLICRGKKFNE